MITFSRASAKNVRESSSRVARGNPARSESVVQEHPSIHLQRMPGIQTALGLTAESFSTPRENTGGAHVRGPSWEFSKIPIFPPDSPAVSGTSPVSAPVPVQRKLAVGEVNDPLEHEADRVADQVMRMPHPRLQRKCSCGGTCPECSRKDEIEPQQGSVQVKHVGPTRAAQTEVPPIVHEVLRSPGQPLDPITRAYMEPRFGHDFSRVRIHTDTAAGQSARDINAHAYTAGHIIVLGHGQYAPTRREGQKLIAHELVHVVQQSRTYSSVQRTPARPDKTPDELAAEIRQLLDRTQERFKDYVTQLRPDYPNSGDLGREAAKRLQSDFEAVFGKGVAEAKYSLHGSDHTIDLFLQEYNLGIELKLSGDARTEQRRAFVNRAWGAKGQAEHTLAYVSAEEWWAGAGDKLPPAKLKKLRSDLARLEKLPVADVEAAAPATRGKATNRPAPGGRGRSRKPDAPRTLGGRGTSKESQKGSLRAGKVEEVPGNRRAGGGKPDNASEPPTTTAPKPEAAAPAKTSSETGGGEEITAETGAPMEPVVEATPGLRSEGGGLGGAIQILQAMQIGNVQQAEIDKFRKRYAELQPKIDGYLGNGYSVQLILIVEKPNSFDFLCGAGAFCDPSQLNYFHDLYIDYVESAKPYVSSPAVSGPTMGAPGGRNGFRPYTRDGGSIIEKSEIPFLSTRDPNHHCEYAEQTLYPRPSISPSESSPVVSQKSQDAQDTAGSLRGIAGSYQPEFRNLFQGDVSIIPFLMTRRLQVDQAQGGRPKPRMWWGSEELSYSPYGMNARLVMNGRFALGKGVPPDALWFQSGMEYPREGLILEWAKGMKSDLSTTWDALISWHRG